MLLRDMIIFFFLSTTRNSVKFYERGFTVEDDLSMTDTNLMEFAQ
jgi:hypothetical protein